MSFNVLKFSREVKAEMAKVTWPDFKTTRGMTLMVFVLVFFVSLYLWIVDFALSSGIQFLINKLG